jgi:hypothetical protein
LTDNIDIDIDNDIDNDTEDRKWNKIRSDTQQQPERERVGQQQTKNTIFNFIFEREGTIQTHCAIFLWKYSTINPILTLTLRLTLT